MVVCEWWIGWWFVGVGFGVVGCVVVCVDFFVLVE